jgi:RNA polymerase sigma-70 factor (ECF subfamily)
VRHAPDLGSADEATVVALAKSGDQRAFEELVKRRQSWLRNLLRRMCGDAHLADDLAQQALLKAWRSMRSLKANRAFGSWLRRMAVNAWLDHLRGNDPLDAVAPDGDAAIEAAESAGAVSIAEGIDLNRALASLAAPVRVCIVLSYGEGMTHSEIADLTELPLGTVKSHIGRGLVQLRKLVGPEGL